MKLPKFNFSKIAFVLAVIPFYYIIFLSSMLMIQTLDLSPLVYLIPATAVTHTGAHAFYTNKAKSENLSKGKLEILREKAKILKGTNLEVSQEEILHELETIETSIDDKINTELSESINENIVYEDSNY